MTIFRLKQLSSHARVMRRRRKCRWDYDRAELIADGVVHVLGIAVRIDRRNRACRPRRDVCLDASEIVSVSVYVAGLLAMLGAVGDL